MIPLVVKAQQNAAKMNNNLPQMQVLQMKMSEARQSGNQLEGTNFPEILDKSWNFKNLNYFSCQIHTRADVIYER